MSEYPQQEPMEDGPAQLPLRLLKASREQQGKSLDEVADRLNISLVHLNALESGDIQSLPGFAFACGYVRNYARLLGLDAEPLILDFKAAYGSGSQRPVRTINRVRPQAHLDDPIIRASVVVFILVLIGSSVWWWQAQMGGLSVGNAVRPLLSTGAVLNGSALPDSVDSQVPVVAVAITVENAEAAVSSAEVLAALPVDQSDSNLSEPQAESQSISDVDVARLASQLEPLSVQQEQQKSSDSKLSLKVATTVSDQPENQSDSRAESSLLSMQFSSACWVSIKNADGKTVFAGLFQAGDILTRELDSLPLELLVGSVSAVVQAEFQGQPLLLAERARKDVARLTLQ